MLRSVHLFLWKWRSVRVCTRRNRTFSSQTGIGYEHFVLSAKKPAFILRKLFIFLSSVLITMHSICPPELFVRITTADSWYSAPTPLVTAGPERFSLRVRIHCTANLALYFALKLLACVFFFFFHLRCFLRRSSTNNLYRLKTKWRTVTHLRVICFTCVVFIIGITDGPQHVLCSPWVAVRLHIALCIVKSAASTAVNELFATQEARNCVHCLRWSLSLMLGT